MKQDYQDIADTVAYALEIICVVALLACIIAINNI